MKAYDIGYLHGSSGQKQVAGRAYESEKANKAYFEGFADGVRARHPGQMIVQCNRDSTIFAAYPQEGFNYAPDGSKATTKAITCPTCARRYFFSQETPEDMKGYPGPGWYSDRKLTILIPRKSSPGDSHEVGGII